MRTECGAGPKGRDRQGAGVPGGGAQGVRVRRAGRAGGARGVVRVRHRGRQEGPARAPARGRQPLGLRRPPHLPLPGRRRRHGARRDLEGGERELVEPTLPPFQLAGPMELWIQDGDDVRLALPVSAGVRFAPRSM